MEPIEDLRCAICGVPCGLDEVARRCAACSGSEWNVPEGALLVDWLASDPGARVRHSYATPA